MALAVGFEAWILPGKSNKDSAAVLPATMSTTFDADTSEDQRQAGSRIERKNVVNRATEKIEETGEDAWQEQGQDTIGESWRITHVRDS